jgi:uncharacterized protein YggE
MCSHPARIALSAALAVLFVATASGGTLYAQTPFVPPATTNSGATAGPNSITAVGQGTASLPPDKAVISASVQMNAQAGPDALSQTTQTVQAVIAALEGVGVSDGDIQTTQLTLYPVFSNQGTYTYASSAAPQPSPPPTVSYYEASEGIAVTTTDLSRLPDLVQAMVNAGITTFSGIQYTWQDPEQLRTMATQAASADAQHQAQALAASLGVSLGQVLTSSLTYSSAPPAPYFPVPQVVGSSGLAVPAPAPPPVASPIIQPGQQSATASVTVTYAIAGR